MTEWPRILVDADDDRPAREDEVEYCQQCGAAVLEWALQRHLGQWWCDECDYLSKQVLKDRGVVFRIQPE